jgi:hypothetical protein
VEGGNGMILALGLHSYGSRALVWRGDVEKELVLAPEENDASGQHESGTTQRIKIEL